MWNVDFTGTTDSVDILPGEYIAQVRNIEKKEGTNYPYLLFELTILSGAAKGLSINHICTLKPKGLFNLRNTLIACGLNVPKAAVRVDPKQIIGRKLGIVVGTREYEGKPYPQVKKTKPVGDAITSFEPPITKNIASIGETTIITDDDL